MFFVYCFSVVLVEFAGVQYRFVYPAHIKGAFLAFELLLPIYFFINIISGWRRV